MDAQHSTRAKELADPRRHGDSEAVRTPPDELQLVARLVELAAHRAMDAGRNGCGHAAENGGEPGLEKLLCALDAELMVSASAGTLTQQRWDYVIADLSVLVDPIQPVQEGGCRHTEQRERSSMACEAAACGALLYLRNAYRFRPFLVEPAVLDRHEDLFCDDVKLLLGHFDPPVWGALFLALAGHGERGHLSTDAMLLMATMVNHGVGVPQDKGLAADLEQLAAALANPVGVFFRCVADGEDSDCFKAARMGHSTAALYYSNGLDSKSSLGWYKYAIARVLADQGLLLASRIFSLSELLYNVKGVDMGRNAWYIVHVKPDSVGDFFSAFDDKMMHLTEHGSVFSSAFGDAVPEAQKEKARKYFESFCPTKVCLCSRVEFTL